MALEIRVLEDGEWKDVKPLSALYGRRFDEIRIKGVIRWADIPEWDWFEGTLMGRLAPYGEVTFGGS